jgi:asparagine N-glycosylation enzyme membrane subunit Stt3
LLRLFGNEGIEGMRKEARMLYTIIAVLFVLWLLGFVMSWGGPLIHLLLVVAVVLFLFNIITGRRTTV